MSKYETKLKEIDMLIQKEKLNNSRASEELLSKYYAKRKQLLNLIGK
jgi:hypothetical protein